MGETNCGCAGLSGVWYTAGAAYVHICCCAAAIYKKMRKREELIDGKEEEENRQGCGGL